jgi:hypothetical protein
MAVTMAAAKTQVQDAHPSKFINSTASSLLYSFDGARIHQSALKLDAAGQSLLSKVGWNAAMQVTLPRYAPDLHRVIEHAHGRAEQKFRRWLYLHPRNFSTEEYKAKFKQIFLEANTKAVIKADVAGLHDVYEAVYTNGGNWAPARLR